MKETEEMIHMSRKTAVSSFITLCALILVAAPAFAQEVFSVSQLAQQVRIEGLTETLGAIQLTATSPSGSTVKAGSSITVVYSAGITNLNASGTNNGVLTCSAGIAVCGNLTVGAVASGSTSLTISVGADTTFTNGSFILISQVRVNVNALGASATTVSATLSGTSSFPTTFPLTFVNGTVTVGSVVSPSLSTKFTAASAIQTCAVPVKTFTVQVTERSPASLTTLADETSFTAGGGGVTAPTNGTSVIVVLSGVPTGFAVQPTGQTAPAAGIYQVTLPAAQTSTGGALTFVFPVAADNTGVAETDTITFTIGLAGAGGLPTAGTLPALGTTATVTGTVSLGPIQATPIVAFAANTQGTNTLATIGDCVTNFMFPYVTNQAGYDSSFSIANTTSDDSAFGAGLGAAPQSGTCTLTFWPTTDQTNVVLGTTLQYTTPSVPSGGVYAFSQSSTVFSGQSGYVIGSCRFLNAHAFAFLTNGFGVSTGPQLSHGYLGLILPNPIARGGVNGETLIH
jgi:hypothetical protein